MAALCWGTFYSLPVNADDTGQPSDHEVALIAAIEASKERALKAFPDLVTEGTLISNKWQEVFERLSAAGDPIVTSPQAPYVVALMAAAELGISPIDEEQETRKRDAEESAKRHAKSMARRYRFEAARMRAANQDLQNQVWRQQIQMDRTRLEQEMRNTQNWLNGQ